VKTVHEPQSQDDQHIFINNLFYYEFLIGTEYCSGLAALAQLLDRTEEIVMKLTILIIITVLGMAIPLLWIMGLGIRRLLYTASGWGNEQGGGLHLQSSSGDHHGRRW
jgi:hypothetical protein